MATTPSAQADMVSQGLPLGWPHHPALEFEQRLLGLAGRLRRIAALRMPRALRARVDPEDLVQDAFLAAVERFSAGDPASAVQGDAFFVWVRGLVLQAAADAWRRHAGASRRSVLREEPTAQAPDWAALASALTSPTRAVLREEAQRVVIERLQSLAEPDREVLELRFMEELKNGEVAAVLGLSPAAAHNRLRRALERLGPLLPDIADGSG